MDTEVVEDTIRIAEEVEDKYEKCELTQGSLELQLLKKIYSNECLILCLIVDYFLLLGRAFLAFL